MSEYNLRHTAMQCIYLTSKISPLDTESNIYINNSVCIPFTTQSNAASQIYHSNAALFIKDTVLSGGQPNSNTIVWHGIRASDNDLMFNESVIITDTNAADTIAAVFASDTLTASNIIISGGYLNYTNGNNTNQGALGVGLRYADSHVQYCNDGVTWYNITSSNDIALADLTDTNIVSVSSNQYIRWNSGTSHWENEGLSIADDTIPSLGGNLMVSSYTMMSNHHRFTDISHNIVLDLTAIDSPSPSDNNYIVIKNSSTNPLITVNGTADVDIGIEMLSKGDGNIILMTPNGGNVVVASRMLEIDGFVKNSIYRTSHRAGGYNPTSSWTIPISSDIILFDFVNSNVSGTYWANVAAGVSDGQKMNLIYHNAGSNAIAVIADFGMNKLGSGNGLSSRIHMNTTGQGASLVYIAEPQNIWQILNTGGQIS